MPPATAETARQTTGFRWGWPAAAAAGAVAAFCCALCEARVMGPQSDGESMVLEAWAMWHGNPLLHDWYVADVSFYTTELPEYVLVELVRGMRPSVVPVCAALTYTLLVLLAAFVAEGGEHGRTGVARVAITVAIMIGPSLSAASYLLNDPDHTGTAVPVLVALALIDRGGRRRWVPVAVAAVLAWALVADPLVLLLGVVPLLAVCGPRGLYLLARRRPRVSAAWYELSLAAAAAAAVAAWRVTAAILRAAGGYLTEPHSQQLKLSHHVLVNARGTVKNFLALYSAGLTGFTGQRSAAELLVTGIHLIAAVLVAVALVMALWLFFRGGDLVASLLATAMVADMLGYTLIYRVSGATIREIAPVFALGAALAGRLLAGPLLRHRLGIVVPALAAAALWAAVPPLVHAKRTAPAAADLAGWLEHRHLRQGIAGFWQANSVTVASGGRVTMRAVRDYPDAGLLPYPWELDRALLNDATYTVNFLVATAPNSQAGSTVTEREGIARFGRPYRVYRFHRYVIMVWRKNLLAELPPPPPSLAG